MFKGVIRMNEHEIIYFMHMPKSGGSTMTNVIQKNLSPHEIVSYYHNEEDFQKKIKQININKIKIIHGHYFFGIHKYIKRPFSYFTILRHPVERVISLYCFLKSIKGAQNDTYRNMTLNEFVERKIEANIQTAYLSGDIVNPSLSKAMNNLRNHFDVIGTTEQFNETLYLLGKRYNWSNLHYRRVNVTSGRLRTEEVSEATKTLIKNVHHLDVLLYEYAKKLLTNQLNQLNKDEVSELNYFIKAQQKFEMRSRL